ncbi:MAG: tRNA threonylcarbamoyladenosine dehydratase [Clostridia bacterium]|nr:tRNA threonylcarbamoyladenosine dehydratase [Clostridia bacterium]
MNELYLRTGMLLSDECINRLRNSHVILFGLGGVGSFTAEALCRCGVGSLTLVDSDCVADSNRNRQLFALTSTVGKKKTEVAKQRLLDINPECKIYTSDTFVLPDNAESFFDTHYDYIADAIDTVSAKLSLVEIANNKNIPIISCMGTGNKLDASRLQISDIKKTSVCPLCRVMRRELKERNISSLCVVWSDETPIKPAATSEESSKRSVPGSISFVPSTAGLLMANKIILDLAGVKL